MSASNVTPAAPEVTTAPEATVPAAPKAPSKKSFAVTIFAEQMAKRAAGEFTSNKAFRATVLNRIVTELGVSIASASTMYNSAKKEAETADAGVALGRDPKKAKAVSTNGKRGRPAGSKNKTVTPTDATPVDAAPTVVVVDVTPAAPAQEPATA